MTKFEKVVLIILKLIAVQVLAPYRMDYLKRKLEDIGETI